MCCGVASAEIVMAVIGGAVMGEPREKSFRWWTGGRTVKSMMGASVCVTMIDDGRGASFVGQR